MRGIYSEAGTGSLIDATRSAPYAAAVPIWGLLTIPGTLPAHWSSSAATGAYYVVIKNCADAPTSQEFDIEVALPQAVLSPAYALDRVRTVFGLNISETAEVFGITRQTAYQWMKFTEMEQVRAHEKRERIRQIYGAAQAWQGLPPLKGRWLRALLPAGSTVLDLLKAPQIDLATLRAAYQSLAAGMADRRRDEGERATQAAIALAGAFAGLGAGRKARKE
jgi:hypothetical protein